MGRVNKFTDGVFVDIVGTSKEKPLYDRFIETQLSIKNPEPDFYSYLINYKHAITLHRNLFEDIALMETIIMQMRSRDNIVYDDIKLYIVREYIYARIPFYRTDKDSKDIRILVGMVEKYGDDIPTLSGNIELLEIAKTKLYFNMQSIINQNIKKYNESISNDVLIKTTN